MVPLLWTSPVGNHPSLMGVPSARTAAGSLRTAANASGYPPEDFMVCRKNVANR